MSETGKVLVLDGVTAPAGVYPATQAEQHDAARLRAQGNRVPFVFITAVCEEGIRTRALKDGAMCFLTKPVDEDVLIRCLAEAVALRCDPAGQ